MTGCGLTLVQSSECLDAGFVNHAMSYEFLSWDLLKKKKK